MRNFVWTVLIVACLLALIGCDGGAANVTPATTTGTPPCAHEYEETVEREPEILVDGNRVCVCSLCGDRYEEAIPATRSIKVLALGNSFSADAMEYLWQICRSGGLEEIVLGNLYVSGCSLDKHWRLINDKVAEYTYYKNTSGVWNEMTATLADTGVLDEDWDLDAERPQRTPEAGYCSHPRGSTRGDGNTLCHHPLAASHTHKLSKATTPPPF